MLNLWNLASRADLLDRRELLRVGGLSLAGLSLPALLGNRTDAAETTNRAKSFGKAKNCIILYLSGGPAQLDTFDPKPDAPEDIRGEFSTIATVVARRALLRTGAAARRSGCTRSAWSAR